MWEILLTIAGVYLSPEGVVLGADSTSSVSSSQGFHFFNHNQKLFEIGEDGTLALLTWGMGGLTSISYRTLLATFSDELEKFNVKTVEEVMQKWIAKFWPLYSGDQSVLRLNELESKSAFGQSPNTYGSRTEDEDKEFDALQKNLPVGFCIAGYLPDNRTPEAHHVLFEPNKPQPVHQTMPQHNLQWFGIPNFFSRLLFGTDDQMLNLIEGSGKWNGTRSELQALALSNAIVPNGTLPIRDAVDYVHTCIYCTIKAIKFSGIPQVCGGPIEIAVITTDRNFRWVRHKTWDAAIKDGGL